MSKKDKEKTLRVNIVEMQWQLAFLKSEVVERITKLRAHLDAIQSLAGIDIPKKRKLKE